VADVRMPDEMIDWMQQRGWGSHHDQWHFERRWDIWHARAARPNAPQWILDMVANAAAQGWTRAASQEGEAGNGEDFLFMHRAMFHLLARSFPQHVHTLRGWHTPPQDVVDAEDPVPGADPPAFNVDMAAAITAIEATTSEFVTDDAFGLFLETNYRPVPDNPEARSTDPRTGLHNYLHNRWTEAASDINLGDPRVNIFNRRFWKLHGWIYYFWWRFRAGIGASDADPAYVAKLEAYLEMMDETHGGGHGPHEAVVPLPTRNVFAFD
jgi:hypothetical protein